MFTEDLGIPIVDTFLLVREYMILSTKDIELYVIMYNDLVLKTYGASVMVGRQQSR